MFLLCINIDHLKLLKRDSHFKLDDLEESLKGIITSWGGEESGISPYITIHPDGFDHSRNWLLGTINSLVKFLSSFKGLVGYSLVVDRIEGELSEEINDRFRMLQSRVTRVDSVWFSSSVCNILGVEPLESRGEMNLISTPIEILSDKSFKINYDDLERIGSSRYRYKEVINYKSSKEIISWGEELGIDNVLLFDSSNDDEVLFSFVNYLISKKNLFNPSVELDATEMEKWGAYLDFYNSISSGDPGCWVIDSPYDHLTNLIELWLESFCSRFQLLLIVNTDCIIPGINRENIITVFSNSKRENSLDTTFISELDIESLRVLFCALVTSGYISVGRLKDILTSFGYRGIYITELLEYFQLKGIFWGDLFLYGSNISLVNYIEETYREEARQWSRDLIDELSRGDMDYLTSKLLVTISKGELPKDIVHKYIDTTIDMGLRVVPQDNFSREMYIYCKRKSRRFFDSIMDSGDSSISREIKYLDISDRVARKELENVVQDSKALFISYQQIEDRYNECKSKVLFSLSLISTGRVNEAIDYLELNANYSLSINDYNSFIRSNCYLMASMLIKGNLTGVIRVYNNNLTHQWFPLKTRWYLYSNFMAARAMGELGDYDKAIKLLSNSINIAKERKYTDATRVIGNWIGLFTAYSGAVQEGVDIIYRDPLNYESYYFLSIIESIRGNLNSALEFIDRGRREVSTPLVYDDRVDWRDGYSFVEELYVVNRTKSVIFHEINNFYNYIATLNGIDKKDDLERTNSDIANDSTLVKDIKSLYYFYNLIREDNSITGSSKEKVIDKSVRLIQQRGNNIDSHNRKVSYYNNFWNKIIMENKR